MTSARVLRNLQAACEFRASFTLWNDQSLELERAALQLITDEDIDEVFSSVSLGIDDAVRAAVAELLQRLPPPYEAIPGVEQEPAQWIADCVKRDASWAGVEHVIERPGFFHSLLRWHRRGRWPCSWDGRFPHGNVVVL
jgi:hypothetical protein